MCDEIFYENFKAFKETERAEQERLQKEAEGDQHVSMLGVRLPVPMPVPLPVHSDHFSSPYRVRLLLTV